MISVTASEIGQYIQKGCSLKYGTSTSIFNPELRGQIVEKIIKELIISQYNLKYDFFRRDLKCIDVTTYIDYTLAKYFHSLQKYSEEERDNLKTYLLKTISSLFFYSNGFINTLYDFYVQFRNPITFEKRIKGKIGSYNINARIDYWYEIGLQVIIGEIKDRIWLYPFPNPGDYVQALLGALLASRKGLILKYFWILYVPVSKCHYLCLYPGVVNLLVETLLRYNKSLYPNSCDWCKSLYKKCPYELIGGETSD